MLLVGLGIALNFLKMVMVVLSVLFVITRDHCMLVIIGTFIF